MTMDIDGVQGDCGVPAAQKTVVRETASKGRMFWTCGNNDACSLFKWVEDVPPASNTRPVIPAKRPYMTVSVILLTSSRPLEVDVGTELGGTELRCYKLNFNPSVQV